MYDPTSAKELRQWRQRMRDNRADMLKTGRKCARQWGKHDALTNFYNGMAGGYNVALIHIEHLVRYAEAKEILGMEELS